MKWVEKEVEAAMCSFEGLQRADAPHFLFTRVEASLNKEVKGFWFNFALFLSRPVVTIAMVLAIICLNTLAYYNHNDVLVTIADEDHAFAGEYSIMNNTTQDESVYTLNEDQ